MCVGGSRSVYECVRICVYISVSSAHYILTCPLINVVNLLAYMCSNISTDAAQFALS